ncbi:MAG: aminoglycoside 6-adenylyltransferase [Eubacteriales bacterium]
MELNTNEYYMNLESKFIQWANSCDAIKAAFIVGSRARIDHPADEWSDLDIMIGCSDHLSSLLESIDWIEELGHIWSTLTSYTAGGDQERLVLFEGGYQVDFVFVPYEKLQYAILQEFIPDIFYRGVRLIIDKDKSCGRLIPQSFSGYSRYNLDEGSYKRNIYMFWFVVVYLAKQLLREELWIVKTKDNELKAPLLQMVEWHAKVTHDEKYDVWHAGRFIHEWADSQIFNRLQQTFACYNIIESWKALITAVNLHRDLAKEVAAKCNYTYPYEMDANITKWLYEHSSGIEINQ